MNEQWTKPPRCFCHIKKNKCHECKTKQKKGTTERIKNSIWTYIWKPFCIFSERFSSVVVLSLLIFGSNAVEISSQTQASREFYNLNIFGERVRSKNEWNVQLLWLLLKQTAIYSVTLLCLCIILNRTVIWKMWCLHFGSPDVSFPTNRRKCWIDGVATARTMRFPFDFAINFFIDLDKFDCIG